MLRQNKGWLVPFLLDPSGQPALAVMQLIEVRPVFFLFFSFFFFLFFSSLLPPLRRILAGLLTLFSARLRSFPPAPPTCAW